MKRLILFAIAATTIGSFPRIGWTQSSPALTTVRDTVYKSDGTPASGTVVITWQSFVTADSKPVFGGTKTVPLSSGALAVALVPNSGGTPSGTSYNVRYYQSGGVFFEETWLVPSSSPMPAPDAPTVTPQGATGSTTYCYWISATNASGETLLGSKSCISNGNAVLNGTNYNQVSWSSVTGASGYKVYRTANGNTPSGSGNYLVGTTTATSINDQSSSLIAAAIPVLNTTDPRTLANVRVTAAPSTSTMLAAGQVTGTAIVSNPSSTQTITAPSNSGTPLQITGRNNNASNVFEIYDNQATPQLQGSFTSGGLFHLGASSGFSTSLQTYYNNFQNSVAAVNPAGVGRTLGVLSQDNDVSHNPTALWAVQESTNTSGTRSSATALEGAAYHTAAGNLTDLEGIYGYVENSSSSATVAKAAALSTQAVNSGAGTTQNLVGVQVSSNSKSAGTVTTNFGIKMEDQNISGATNYAIYSGAGLVEHRDVVRLGNSAAQMQFSAGGNTLSAVSTTSGTNAGSFTLRAQNVASGSGAGGDLNLVGGDGSGTSTNGNVLIRAGETASPGSATTGGGVEIRTGLPSNSNATGDITLRGYTNAATPVLTTWLTVNGATGLVTASRASVSHQEAVTFSTTPAFDASLGNSFKMTLTGSVTSSTISNGQTGQFITLLLCQDVTGSRTMTWPSNLRLAGGTYTLTTAANTCDSVTVVYDGTNWFETSRTSNL